jgi:predicted ATP-binding protein involved in virulence
MRIDELEVRNFKKFADQRFEFHRQFTLLVGENGSGKTSVLDALAVALGVWLVDAPDSDVSGRPIYPSEIRLEGVKQGDRLLFQEAQTGVLVKARGRIEEHENVTWARRIGSGKKRTSNKEAKAALDIIRAAVARAKANEQVILPVLAYYGAGRAWMPHHERSKTKGVTNGPAKRWAAFYDCLNERIRMADLASWFRKEAIAASTRAGQFRPGFEVVRRAVLRCVPGADGLWFDGDRDEIVLSLAGQAQPFSNLSAGQRMMLALVADIAIKAVNQNNFLVPPDTLQIQDDPLPRVLGQTPGVVLIDELDVHLHPRWQRRVAADLKGTFPMIQFVCTSHSPQVIGEVLPDEIRLLGGEQIERPAQSFGMDSNWILRVLMGAADQDADVDSAVKRVFDLISAKELDEAAEKVLELRERVGNSESIQRAASTIERVKVLGK